MFFNFPRNYLFSSLVIFFFFLGFRCLESNPEHLFSLHLSFHVSFFFSLPLLLFNNIFFFLTKNVNFLNLSNVGFCQSSKKPLQKLIFSYTIMKTEFFQKRKYSFSHIYKSEISESSLSDTPLSDFLSPFRPAATQWVARYVFISFAVILRLAVGLGLYSGMCMCHFRY